MNKKMFKKDTKGFTLIELLIVIIIIAILSVVVFVAVDPLTRFADSRNAKRYSEVNSILEALLKYQVDNRGYLPNNGTSDMIDATTATSQIIGTDLSGCDSGCTAAGITESACVDLGTYLVDNYLAGQPFDPIDGNAGKTLYYVNKTANGRIKVGSCGAENSASISTQR